MIIITQICLECNSQFSFPKISKARSRKYCSLKCSGLYTSKIKRQKIKIPNASCAYCDVKFYRSPSALKDTKNGLHFCNYKHKSLAQTINYDGKALLPREYDKPSKDYRSIAFRNYERKCSKCLYETYPEILEVHHKDRDRNNNLPDNLEILCPNCHLETHFLNKDGRFTKT